MVVSFRGDDAPLEAQMCVLVSYQPEAKATFIRKRHMAVAARVGRSRQVAAKGKSGLGVTKSRIAGPQ